MATEPHRTVDLYVRSDAPAVHRRTDVIHRLAQAVRRNRVDEFDVHVWPRAVSLDTELGGDILETVRTFERWALSHGRRIGPTFDVRTVRSTIVDETDDRLVLPVLCVAAYVDGELVALAPCREGRSTVTVEDVLDAVATGSMTVPESDADGGSGGDRSDGGVEPTARAGDTDPTGVTLDVKRDRSRRERTESTAADERPVRGETDDDDGGTDG